MVSYPQVYPQNCGLVDNFVDNYGDNVNGSEVYMDNQKKVLKLLDYIRKVVSLRQKLVRSIKDEEWTLYLDELPVDPKRIRVQPEGAG